MSRSYLLSLALILLALAGKAQDENLEVIRSTALPWGSPVRNIFVDTDNTKWVANTQNIKKVIGARSSDPITLQPGEMGLFQFPGGNADIRWQKQALLDAIGDIIDEDNYITAAFYDEINQDIWLGTSLTGAYRLKQENGTLAFKEQLSMDNTKLRSNFVHDIAKDGPGRIWIGTNDGALVGKAGKWDLLEKGLIIEAIAIANGEVWLMGDGLVGKVDRRDRWELTDLPSDDIEGTITDIALDGKGQLWIASRIITRYDPATGETKVFGGAEEYTSEFANHLAVDLDGAVWIGTEDKGVYVIQKGSSLVATVELVSPVTCDGNGADGALRVKVSGGTPPYSFNWTGNAEGNSPERLSPGTYRLTITDTKGNSRLADISVPDRRISLRAEAKSKVSAAGAADGQAEARVQGGMPPYKYTWDNGEATPVAMKLVEGAHTVSVTDRLGCEATAVVNVSRTLESLAVQIEQIKPIKCQGNKSAVLKAVAEGGAKPYTYQWSVADAPTPQLTGLLAGDYAVTITDANGTVASAAFTVEEPAGFDVQAQVARPASANGSDGAAVVEASGGVPPYQYQWSTGAAEATLSGLSAGKYTVTVTDANGCETTAEVVIGEDILPLSLTIAQDKTIDCQGAASAALSAKVTGGKSPFTYAWSDGKSSENIKGLTAGTYALTVTDAAGTAANASVDVKEPEALKARASQVAPANTGASDGAAQVTGSGGVPPYTYLWTNGAGTPEITNLVAGAYVVTVTDKNGCQATAKVDVTEDIAPLEVQLEASQPISCAEASDGQMVAMVSGGKGPFAYAWSNGSTAEGQLKSLPAGTYTLTITDVVGNTASAELLLNAPPKLKIGVEVTGEASPGQADGRAVVNATGGNEGYQYIWSSGETGAEALQLPSGMQSVTVTDAKGCNSSISVEMIEDIRPLQVSVAQNQAITCAEAEDGGLSATIEGGKGPYTYSWSNGADGEEATGLPAGAYTVTVTDAQGTTAEATLSLTAPAPVQATAAAVQPASTNNSDGVARGSAQGGAPPYTYAWSTGASTAEADGLPPGDHTVTITDANSCAATATVSISENILPLQVSLIVVTPVDCNGGATGAVASEVNGGKPPYTYQWMGAQEGVKATGLTAGTYTLTVSDAAGTTAAANIVLSEPEALSAGVVIIQPASTNAADGKAKASASGGTPPYTYDWSTDVYAELADNLPPGTHSVTVTDAKGCTVTESIAITENILPLELSLEVSAPINCKGGVGALNAVISGGKPPFAYDWSNGATEPQAAGLSAGAYQLTLTDAAGTTVESELALSEPELLSAEAIAVQPASTNNSDGIAKATAKGGTAPYTYAWSTGASTPQADGLSPTAHTLTVTDAKGCTAEASVTISENILPLQVQLEATQAVSCSGATDAAVQATINGGKPPYTITWSDESTSGENRRGLGAGQYEITVTDEAGNEASAAVTLTAPEPLTAELGRVEPAFSDSSEDGKAEVSGKGGTPPYRIAWDNGSTGPKVENLSLGQHSVTITDANGCTASDEFEITERVLKELTRAVSSGQTIQMQKLQFEADSSRIQESVKPLLNEIYIFLNDNPSIVVEIGGHTNNLPPDEYCDQLSTARARAVAEYLVAKGIPSDRVFYKGYGKRKPLFSNRTEDGRRRNQRVEIKILRL
ncbi:MAG: OmpA family protein [Phaeodactylibacter sp.]|uniref:OmpA family protein n=1 Tax=Phaeodactylibacter sp. TaxID=1940289 RepID=UPI0032EC4553